MQDNKLAIDLAVNQTKLDFFIETVKREREILKEEFESELDNIRSELQDERDRIKQLEEKLAYYDRAAVKYGTIAIVIIAIGAYLSSVSDKTREVITKILEHLL
jgi:hypothetical protein